jgi:hypothetical protein
MPGVPEFHMLFEVFFLGFLPGGGDTRHSSANFY